MKRIPVLPTIVVALACVAMIGLGIWQLQRLSWKEAMLRQYAANQGLPAITFPQPPVGDANLFRRSSAICLDPTHWTKEAGRDRSGHVGWRQIARCSTGAEGPGFQVQIGLSSDPNWKPDWKGGPVSGFISHAPDATPLIARMLGRGQVQELMLVTDAPPAGLSANQSADLGAVPNNHLAYAVQWFIFAALAAAIYAIALVQRAKKAPQS